MVDALAKEHSVDVLILAESKLSDADLLEQLNTPETEHLFHLLPGAPRSMRLFTRFEAQFVVPMDASARYSILALSLPGREQIILVVAHLPSKLHQLEASQAQECTRLARTIREQEKKVSHGRTLLVGDLNMNPFETGLVSAAGLHAVMSRDVARGRSRIVQKVDYPFFYNPMWSHFGDGGTTPPGTYFYERAEHVNYFWNIFDQVLVRPELMDRFPNDALRILTNAGPMPLVTDNGRPDPRKASDHLPILFKLDMMEDVWLIHHETFGRT